MKSHLLTVVLGGLLGTLAFAGNAEACHKKSCGHKPAPVCVPAPVCAPVVCEAPAPVPCAPKKACHFKMPKIKLGCHKKAAPVCVASYEVPVSYAAPIYAAPQASMQQ